jgi:hypothetical protein
VGATVTVTGERHHVRLQEGEQLLPGEYTLRDGATVRRISTTEPCPYCRGPLTHLQTIGALRVIKPEGTQVAGVQTVLAEPIPTTVRLLKCNECSAFFTAGDGNGC